MRQSVEQLRAFYGEPTGRLARRVLAQRLEDVWGEAPGSDVLGIGYASPWLDVFVGARRTIAAMPGRQGAEAWPAAGRNRSLLVDEERLPFAAGAFDRVLLVHALEEADDAGAMLREAVRVLAPAGRLIVVAAARGGLWARSETMPFGHGRPFSRRQLEALVHEAGLEPTAWSQTLYTPPWRPLLGLADTIEPIGRKVAPAFAGLILLEATRQMYARIEPAGQKVRVRATAQGLAPASRARGSSVALRRERP